MTTVETMDDGSYKVTVKLDDFERYGYVSSAHLVEGKEAQLIRCIHLEAKEALLNNLVA